MKSFDVTAEIITDADEVVTVTGTYYPAVHGTLTDPPCNPRIETEETSEAARVALWTTARITLALAADDYDTRPLRPERDE